MRLGSYQRELPQRELEAALQDAVSTAITQAGVDVFHADVDVLKRILGMTNDAAKAVVKACHDDKIVNRDALMPVLREHLSEMQARQAIGFLKIFGSTEPLDGTTIHPDDYRLAERLVAHANLALPASCPNCFCRFSNKGTALSPIRSGNPAVCSTSSFGPSTSFGSTNT